MTKTVEVPARLLALAGRALCGDEWVRPLAFQLGIRNVRTLERWAQAARDGEAVPVSRSLVAEVCDLLASRIDLGAEARDQLRQLLD